MRVTLVIPVHNEERRLPASIGALLPFLSEHAEFEWEVVIADNGSTDRTLELSSRLENHFAEIHTFHVDLSGRGRAVKQVWMQSEADIVSYMDVDLSTDLEAYPLLIQELASGRFDMAIGSRLSAASRTTRGLLRGVISRGYNWLARLAFQTHFPDAQCGFKGMTRRAAQALLPLVEDGAWFFDTELLVLAEKLGYRVLDVPVQWVENPDSRVKIMRTAIEDVKGIIRVHRKLKNGEYVGQEKRKVVIQQSVVR